MSSSKAGSTTVHTVTGENVVPSQINGAFKALRYLPIQFFEIVRKINKVGRAQIRVIILSETHLYSCRPDGDIQRSIAIDAVSALMVNRQRQEVGLVVASEYDMLLNTEKMDALLACFPGLEGLERQGPLDTQLRLEKPPGFSRLPPGTAVIESAPLYRKKSSFKDSVLGRRGGDADGEAAAAPNVSFHRDPTTDSVGSASSTTEAPTKGADAPAAVVESSVGEKTMTVAPVDGGATDQAVRELRDHIAVLEEKNRLALDESKALRQRLSEHSAAAGPSGTAALNGGTPKAPRTPHDRIGEIAKERLTAPVGEGQVGLVKASWRDWEAEHTRLCTHRKEAAVDVKGFRESYAALQAVVDDQRMEIERLAEENLRLRKQLL